MTKPKQPALVEVVERPTPQVSVTLGDFVKSRREELELSQRQTGLKSGHLSQIESGEIPHVSPAILVRLAKGLGFSLSELVQGGVEIDTERLNQARAIVVGEAVLSLPDELRQHVVAELAIEDLY